MAGPGEQAPRRTASMARHWIMFWATACRATSASQSFRTSEHRASYASSSCGKKPKPHHPVSPRGHLQQGAPPALLGGGVPHCAPLEGVEQRPVEADPAAQVAPAPAAGRPARGARAAEAGPPHVDAFAEAD